MLKMTLPQAYNCFCKSRFRISANNEQTVLSGIEIELGKKLGDFHRHLATKYSTQHIITDRLSNPL